MRHAVVMRDGSFPKSLALPRLGEARAGEYPSTAAQQRTRACKMCRNKLLFHAGVRAAESETPPGLEKPAPLCNHLRPMSTIRSVGTVLNQRGILIFYANGCDIELLFASLLETIAQPSFPSLLEAQLLGDRYSGIDKAVQCHLVHQRD